MAWAWGNYQLLYVFPTVPALVTVLEHLLREARKACFHPRYKVRMTTSYSIGHLPEGGPLSASSADIELLLGDTVFPAHRDFLEGQSWILQASTRTRLPVSNSYLA